MFCDAVTVPELVVYGTPFIERFLNTSLIPVGMSTLLVNANAWVVPFAYENVFDDNWEQVYEVPSITAVVPLPVQYSNPSGIYETYMGCSNCIITLAVRPAYVAVTSTLPGFVPDMELIADPAESLVVALGAIVYPITFAVNATVAPLSG